MCSMKMLYCMSNWVTKLPAYFLSTVRGLKLDRKQRLALTPAIQLQVSYRICGLHFCKFYGFSIVGVQVSSV
jgi:hypothetical protein